MIAASFLGGCQKPSGQTAAVRMEQEIAPWPAKVGPAQVTLKMFYPDGQPVLGAQVSLEGDMSHPGMRPEFGRATETGAGRYEGHLTFTMPGDWVVLAQVTMPGGQKLERQMEVKGVRAQ